MTRPKASIMQQDIGQLSYIQPYGYYTSSCGYCSGSRVTDSNAKDESGSPSPPVESRASLYARAKKLTVSHYKQLLDRAWRRSGSLLYKPDNLHSCCPHYTIRLPVHSFKPRRDQRSACNRWNRFVLGDEYIKESTRLYPRTKADKAKQKNEFDLVSTIHEAEYATLRTPPTPAHRFEVNLEPDTFTREKYDLYLNYQVAVHHEEASKNTPDQFARFLCESPLDRSERTVNGVNQKLGSYHQMYRLDGRLIAMGVLDLLPDCVSGVYFIYHSDFEKYSLGKLSALREACLALEGQYEYYYMGFYIHSCPKMKYKFDYMPQHILDCNNWDWNQVDETLTKLLDKHHFFSFSTLQEKAKHDNVDVLDIEKGWPTNGSLGDSSTTAKQIEQLHNAQKVSLFNLNFPGMMSLNELRNSDISVGAMLSQSDDDSEMEPLLPPDRQHFANYYLDRGGHLFGYLAELVACVGTDLAKEIVICLR